LDIFKKKQGDIIMFSGSDLDGLFGNMVIGLILIGIVIGVVLCFGGYGLWHLFQHINFTWIK